MMKHAQIASRFLPVGMAFVAFSPLAANADTSLTKIDGLGASGSTGYAISADGSTVVGAAELATTTGYFWNSTDGMTGLESLASGTPGDCESSANAVNADGSVIVGYSLGGLATYTAVRWIDGVIDELANPYGDDSEATAVSGDGTVIAGNRDNGGTNEAFIWTTGTGSMAALTGVAGESYAYALSSDGVYVGGASDVGGTQVAMRWSSAGGLESLGTIGSFAGSSYVYALNADGSVATGFSASADGNQAFRWVEGSGMTGLGSLTAGSQSYGQAISADGSIVVGMNVNGGVKTAFRWSEIYGMEALADILADAEVDITGWTLEQARGISADGTLIAGTGTFGGDERAFFMSADALITPEELTESLAPVVAPGDQAQGLFGGFVNDLLSTARNAFSAYFGSGVAAAGGNRPIYASASTGTMNDASPLLATAPRYAFYATGSLGFGKSDGRSNDTLSGTTGILVDMGDDLAFGAGVIGSDTDQDTHLKGNTGTRALGGSLVGAYEPSAGFRFYAAAAAARLDVDTDRRYLNGAAVDASQGDTSGTGYALAGRVGYEFPLTASVDLMPYGEIEWSRTSLDSYTETGGGIPAIVGEQKSRRLVSRLGAEMSASLTDDLLVRFRSAWGHRLSGDTGSIYVTALGIGQTVQAAQSKDDWVEAGASLNYDIGAATTLGASVDTRYSGSSDSSTALTLSLVYRLQ